MYLYIFTEVSDECSAFIFDVGELLCPEEEVPCCSETLLKVYQV
jgi:hypothetical protein